MDKRIAILRGINVGGKRKILMADLKLLLEKKGLKNVKTYIQSGNVIFEDDKKTTAIDLANTIEKAILDQYEFIVPVIVRSAKEMAKSVRNNPFYEKDQEDIKPLHLTFLKEKPSTENRKVVEAYHHEPDKFQIKDKDVFIFCEGKYHQSKLTNNFFEKKLKVSATTRNWKTVLKLLELSS